MAKRKRSQRSARKPRKSLLERRQEGAKKGLVRKAQKLARADKWPLRECLINASWREAQMAVIVVSRNRPDGSIAGAMCLVDMGCMGVKEAQVGLGMGWGVYSKMRRVVEDLKHGETIDCPPELALKIILTAKAYGEELGFVQAEETPLVLALLKNVDASSCSEDVEVGKDGMPNYIRSSGDADEAVLAHLQERVGPEGFMMTVEELPG